MLVGVVPRVYPSLEWCCRYHRHRGGVVFPSFEWKELKLDDVHDPLDSDQNKWRKVVVLPPAVAWCCSLPLGAAFSSSFRVGLRSTHPSLEWRGSLLLLAPLWVGLVGFLLHWVVLPAFLSSKQHHPQGKWKKAPPLPKKEEGGKRSTPKGGAGTLSTLLGKW